MGLCSFVLKVKSMGNAFPLKRHNLGRCCFFKTCIRMAATIITTDELREFKLELLEAFKELLAQQGDVQQKRWMKSKEVRDLLGISPGTLQNLRVNGTLPFSKVGGVLYYQYQDVMQVLEQNRVDSYVVCKR